MIAHYLKVAFRNLWKYKTQHIVSVFLSGDRSLGFFTYDSLCKCNERKG